MRAVVEGHTPRLEHVEPLRPLRRDLLDGANELKHPLHHGHLFAVLTERVRVLHAQQEEGSA